MLNWSYGSPSAPLQWVTLKGAMKEMVVNEWMETKISDWMVAMMDEELGKNKELWWAIRKSTNSETSVLLKNGYGCYKYELNF